jgi:vancomycin permeability regulator SanA
MKKIIMLLVCLFLSDTASAYNRASDKSIKNIRVRPNIAYVKFEGCARYTRISLINDYYKSMLSVALTAAAAGKKVEVVFQNNESCATTEPLIEYIDVKF